MKFQSHSLVLFGNGRWKPFAQCLCPGGSPGVGDTPSSHGVCRSCEPSCLGWSVLLPVLVSFASCVIIRISFCMQGHVCMQYPCSQNAQLLLLLPGPGFCSHVTVCLLNGTALCSLVTGLRILLLWSSEEGDFLCFRVICSLNQKLERKECILYNEQTYDNYIPCNYLNCLSFD